MIKEKIYAFVDSQNLYLGVKSQGWELDYKKFRKYLQNKYNVANAFLFIGYLEGNEKLYTKLQQAGFICVFKPTLEHVNKKTGIKTIKGNVDAELVLHTMINLHNFDKAIVVTSDGDFTCLVEYLADQNKLLKIITTHVKYSSLLRRFSSYILPIKIIQDKLKKESIPAN
jgi:uncharacterized LabA/DUF88 family protein